jgi:hypothetical protein
LFNIVFLFFPFLFSFFVKVCSCQMIDRISNKNHTYAFLFGPNAVTALKMREMAKDKRLLIARAIVNGGGAPRGGGRRRKQQHPQRERHDPQTPFSARAPRWGRRNVLSSIECPGCACFGDAGSIAAAARPTAAIDFAGAKNSM